MLFLIGESKLLYSIFRLNVSQVSAKFHTPDMVYKIRHGRVAVGIDSRHINLQYVEISLENVKVFIVKEI